MATDPTGITTAKDPSGSGSTLGAQGANFSTASSGDDFIKNLQDTLFQSSGMVSSNGSNIDAAIGGAISSLQSSQASTDTGIRADYASQKAQATQQGNNQMNAELEARRGMATNTGIVANVQAATKQQLDDLDEKMQQAISTGDAATASKISDLQVKALEDKQTTMQQAFTNQLSIAASLNQAKATAIDQQKQNFDEQSAVAQIGLQYGIPVKPGMTLADIVSQAAPQASQEEQAKLALTMAQTQQAQAEAAKALAGAKADVTTQNAGAFASTIQNLVLQGRSQEASAFLSNIMSSEGDGAFNLVNNALSKQVTQQFDPNTMGRYFDSQLQGGKSTSDLSDEITNNPFATDAQKKTALSELVDAQGRFTQSKVRGGGTVMVFGKPVDKNSLLGQIFQ